MSDERYGPMYDFDVLTDAVEAQLALWLPEYLAAAERARGRTPGKARPPRRWHVEDDIRDMPEGELPAIVVLAASTSGKPNRNATTIDAPFRLGVGAILAGPDHRERRRLAGIYGAAIRDLLIHQRVPGTQQITWLGTTPEEVTAAKARGHTRMTVIVEFEVKVTSVVLLDGGPFNDEPRPAPGHLEPLPDGPVVTDPNVTLNPTTDLEA